MGRSRRSRGAGDWRCAGLGVCDGWDAVVEFPAPDGLAVAGSDLTVLARVWRRALVAAGRVGVAGGRDLYAAGDRAGVGVRDVPVRRAVADPSDGDAGG